MILTRFRQPSNTVISTTRPNEILLICEKCLKDQGANS